MWKVIKDNSVILFLLSVMSVCAAIYVVNKLTVVVKTAKVDCPVITYGKDHTMNGELTGLYRVGRIACNYKAAGVPDTPGEERPDEWKIEEAYPNAEERSSIRVEKSSIGYIYQATWKEVLDDAGKGAVYKPGSLQVSVSTHYQNKK